MKAFFDKFFSHRKTPTPIKIKVSNLVRLSRYRCEKCKEVFEYTDQELRKVLKGGVCPSCNESILDDVKL